MQSLYIHISPSIKIPLTELEFRTSRSGGPGGQNVNKLETRVELMFDIQHSPSLTSHIRERLLTHLAGSLDSSGVIRIVSQESRSQWKNKQLAIEKLTILLKSALAIRKKRIATKPTKIASEVRLQSKRIRSETKRLRKVNIE